MASTGAKAALLDGSLKRITALLAEFAEATGIEAAKLPDYNRDPELLTAYRLEAMANWLEVVVQRTRVFNALSNPQTPSPGEGELKDAPPGSEAVTGFDITPEGVVVAKTDEGAVTSDGQEPPEGAVAEVLTDKEAASIPPAEIERQPAARTAKNKSKK
jgi:hypothetical protein